MQVLSLAVVWSVFLVCFLPFLPFMACWCKVMKLVLTIFAKVLFAGSQDF